MSSIYDAIGGRDAVAAAVDLFYEKVLADPLLAPYFVGTDLDRLRTHGRRHRRPSRRPPRRRRRGPAPTGRT